MGRFRTVGEMMAFDFHLGCLPLDKRPPLSQEYWREWRRRDSIIRRGAFQDATDVHLHPELPDITEPPLKPQEQVIVHRHSNMSKEDWNLLQQTVRKMQFLENKITEITKKRKPDTKYGYKGIR